MAMYFYNGTMLPEIPSETLQNYPYCWIRQNERTGQYDLFMAKSPWYQSDSTTIYTASYADGIQWYRTTIAEVGSDWTFNQSWTTNGGMADEFDRKIIWSNQNIPVGAVTATAIYFVGSSAVPDAVMYQIQKDTMTGIADQVRRLCKTEVSMTPVQMEEKLNDLSIELMEAHVTSEGREQTIYPEEGYYGFSKITVGAVDVGGGGGGGDGGSSVGADGIISRTATSIVSNTVTTVGRNAFYYFENLLSVSFPLVWNVQSGAFSYCTNLNSVELPSATTIGTSAFNNCESLTTISLPNGGSINERAFHACTNLRSVDLGSTTTIWTRGFAECLALNYIVCDYVEDIKSYGFYSCISLTSINLPRCKTIGNYCFKGCTSLNSITLGDAVCEINSSALNDVPITAIYVPSNRLEEYREKNTKYADLFVGI